MKVILTQRQELTSKKGGAFVILRGVAEDGSTIEAFLSGEQIEQFDVAPTAILKKSEIQRLFQELPAVDIEYNQRGRVVSIRS